MNSQVQSRLLQWAAFFLFLQSSILTLAPAVRERTWDVDYRISHCIGFLIWGLFTLLAHRALTKYLPEHDPYIFPAAALLSGWGLLTIWRLDESFGMKQSAWFGISIVAMLAGTRYLKNLSFLKNYKYIFLGGGLLITALTLLFGTNPLGIGPRLWLPHPDTRLRRPSDTDGWLAKRIGAAGGEHGLPAERIAPGHGVGIYFQRRTPGRTCRRCSSPTAAMPACSPSANSSRIRPAAGRIASAA